MPPTRRLAQLFFALFVASASAAEPSKLLVVTVTTGFRHSSIETAEKVLARLAADSGAFTVDFVHQPEGNLPKNPGRPPTKADSESDSEFASKQEAYSAALAAFNSASEAWQNKVRDHMAKHMSMEKLRTYDGFVFANTTGDLMLPDREGFIDLIAGGKAFIAMHSGSDTYHPFRRYIEMLGGEFANHKQQVAVTPIRHDPEHPAIQPIPEGFRVFDEIYIMKSFKPESVRGLLGLNAHPNDGTPGYFPISWCKTYGKGRLFYTSLGHREDVWDPEWSAGKRENEPAVAQVFQAHILAGIRWALQQLDGSAEPGNLK